MFLATIYMQPTLYRKENTGKQYIMVADRVFEHTCSESENIAFGSQNRTLWIDLVATAIL